MPDYIDNTLAAVVVAGLWITVLIMWIRGARFER